MKVLVFAASLRAASFNRKLARLAADWAAKQEGVTVDHADFREFEMPIFDSDLEASKGLPQGAQEMISRVRSADALIISSPEYNAGMPGVLKNAIDWASRARPYPFLEKHLLLLSASAGVFGGIRGLSHARAPFEFMGTHVFPETFNLARAQDAFDESGALKDAATRDRLTKLLATYLQHVSKFVKAPVGAY